jgi:mannose-1-phosphate guanylyltransferase/mannose-1-phosphate guanylyltransferase/phosphomannomutase
MVMAAGLGTRLRPLTYEVPKPMVPVLNRPVIEHIVRLLRRNEFEQVIANLHWFPDTVRGHLGDGSELGVDLAYSHEEELLDTAGGVWNVRDFLTADGDGSFLVMAGDALTDVDLTGLARAHSQYDGVATLTVKRVPNVSEFGVVVTDTDGRVQGFQEKPDPAEALSDRANCMIYAFRPEIFDYFPDPPFVDWAKQIFPILLENDVPFQVYETDRYWNDVGSVPEYLRGNLDALAGAVDVEGDGEVVVGSDDEEAPTVRDDGWSLTGRVLVGAGTEIGEGARIDGPSVVGPGSRIGAGAMVKRSVLLAGTELPEQAIAVEALVGRRGRLAEA